MPEHVLDIVAEYPKKQHVADQVKPTAMHEHAGQKFPPRRNHLVNLRRMPQAKQLGRDHPEAVEDRPLVLPELPKEGTDAQAYQDIGDDRLAGGRVVVIKRQGEDHAGAMPEPCPSRPTSPKLGVRSRRGPVADSTAQRTGASGFARQAVPDAPLPPPHASPPPFAAGHATWRWRCWPALHRTRAPSRGLRPRPSRCRRRARLEQGCASISARWRQGSRCPCP